MGKSLNTLWFSNSPAVGTGYGNQTELFTRLMKKHGHDAIVRGFWGQHGSVISHDGVTVLPATYDETGSDAIEYDYARFKPDVLVILYDMWCYRPEMLQRLPITSWSPIDHQPAPPQVVRSLTACKWIWAMSRFGEREMRQAGLDPFYVPHGVDTNVYAPSDRSLSRRKWGIPDNKFLVVVNAANKGFPSRKNLDKIMKAWGLFLQQHPDAFLYMHTTTSPVHHGYNILQMAEFYGVPEWSIGFPDQHRLRDGEITPMMLSHLYNAADVFLSPSQGEGFGIPVIEAQSAGCPVIVSDFSAQRELCGAGYKIPVDRIDDLYFTLQGSEQAWIRPSAIITALEWAYEQRGNMALRTQARAFAMDYDAEHVFERYMLPSLKIMVQGNADFKYTQALKAQAA